MRAIFYDRYGSSDVLQLKEMPVPRVLEDEVLVKVHAASVNSWDWDLVRGKPAIYRLLFGFFKPRYPVIGSDISGTVEAVGKKVRLFKPGDEVFGDISSSGFGAFAEYATSKEIFLAHKPKNLSFAESAAIPQAGLLALQALRYKGSVSRGQKVLIIAAGGGVGSFAIQLAKLMGAEVHAVDRTDKFDFMKSVGADEVFDYQHSDFTLQGHTYDLILDNMAQRPVSDCLKILNKQGRYVMTGGHPVRILHVGLFGRFYRDFRVVLLPLQVNADDLKQLASLVESGKLKAMVHEKFPLEKTPEAVEMLGQAKAKGKLVIEIA